LDIFAPPRAGQGHLRLLAEIAHEVASHQEVERLVGAAELDIRLHHDRVVRLHHQVQEFVQENGDPFLVPLGEIVALEEAGDGHLRGQADQLVKRQRLEPRAVAHDLEPVRRQDLPHLVEVGLRVDFDFVRRELGAGLLATAGVAHERRHVADDQNRLMPKVLELAELAEDDRVTQVDVRRAGVDPQLDPERLPLFGGPAKLRLQLGRGVDRDGAALELDQLRLGVSNHGRGLYKWVRITHQGTHNA
jgi:hypothetical protein